MPMTETSATAEKPELPTFGRERPAPGAYYLDLEAVAAFPLKDNGQASTFADIYRKLRDANVQKVPVRFGMDDEGIFETEAGPIRISGETGQGYISGQMFVLNVLRDLIELHKDGIDPYRATWFYYDHDWSCDADEMYLFFVVFDGKIVRERFSFIHADPRVITKYKVDDKPIWRSEPYEREAWETYWYRKFYTETLTGQLMVLRPDEPILYHYQRAVNDASRDVGLLTLIKLYRLLWVAVPLLAAIAFPILRPYMAVLAGVFTADLLWRCWATRKVGLQE